MKVFFATAIGMSPLMCSAASIKRSVDAAFGPQNCVTLTRSTAGSCVMSTDCEGADLSQTEFTFDCVRQGGEIVRHSFGTGGFDPSEEFDTQVTCDRCESASPTDVIVKPAAKKVAPKPVQSEKAKAEVPHTPAAPVVFKAKQRQSTEAQATTKATTKATAKTQFWPFTSSESKEPEVVKYGPNGCVSTWRNSEGHCIMRTSCKKSDISKYEFGLVCVDKVGSPVRHLFGSDSFDTEETFDTLIKCDKCLGLEDIPDAVALNGEVVTLAKDIGNLKAVMKNISINVQMLNAEVFKSSGPAPAPAAAAGPPAAALIHQSTAYQSISDVAQVDQNAQKHNLRHSHKRHRHEDDEDEEDDDEDNRESDVQAAVLRDDEDDAEDED